MSDFDGVVDRRGSNSAKWEKYAGTEILPMWVADMDFKAPGRVIEAIQTRAEHGVFGYNVPPVELSEVFVRRMSQMYGWQIDPADLSFMPGVVPGLNQACRGLVGQGESVITVTPVYFPFLEAPGYWDRALIRVASPCVEGRWGYPVEALRSAVESNPDIKLLMLCNPHNPVGRALTRDELSMIVEICVRHKVLICSDEIHCDLMLDDSAHIPIASISQEAAAITLTLMAPTKTFNLAGLGGAVVVIQDPALRARFDEAGGGMSSNVSTFAYTSMLVAYRDCESWRTDLIAYLRDNRTYLQDRLAAISGVSMSPVEATYLAWLDVRELKLNDAMGFFENAGVGLSDGARFDGPGYMRLNFGCPRSTLALACDRIESAIERHHA